MHRTLWLLKVPLLVLATMLAQPVRAQVSMEVSFNRSIVVGEETTPAIRLSGEWSSHTTCEDFAVFHQFIVKWGDGGDDSWSFRSDGGDHGGPTYHSYSSPGRYLVSVRLEWRIFAIPGSPSCPAITGVLTDAAYLDVTPDESLLVNGWVGTFLDAAGTVCNGPLLPFSRVYVVVGLAGESAGGIAGAEFRLVNTEPTRFAYSAAPASGWIMIGNPLGDGATLGGVCASNPANRVAVLEVTAYAIDGATDGHLFVERHLTPSNPQYPDITLIRCDAPYFTPVGAGRENSALLNPSAEGGSCSTPPVGIEKQSWSTVKALFRDSTR